MVLVNGASGRSKAWLGFPGDSVVKKNLRANTGDMGSIPDLGRSPGERNGNTSIFAWEIPYPHRGLQPMEMQRVGHSLATINIDKAWLRKKGNLKENTGHRKKLQAEEKVSRELQTDDTMESRHLMEKSAEGHRSVWV